MRKNIGKFSESDEEVYEALHGFIRWLAWKSHNPDNVMMDQDDIAQELFVELLKGLDFYSSLPQDEKMAVLRKMLDNRISELRYKFYKTHRGIGNNSASIENDDIQVSSPDSIEELYSSVERVETLRSKVSPFARKVLEVILDGGSRMDTVMKLSWMRSVGSIQVRGRQNVKPWYIPQPYHVCDVLGEPIGKVQDAFKEIKRVWSEVQDGC